jgi:hypothetical protein
MPPMRVAAGLLSVLATCTTVPDEYGSGFRFP